MKFLLDLRKRRRGAVFFMAWITAVLSFLTVKVLMHLLWPNPGSTPTNLTQEWAIIPLFALPWICLGVFVRLYRRHRREHADYAHSIQSSVAALLDENRLAQRRQKWVAVLNVLVLLVLPVTVYQLRAVGKAGDEILLPFLVFYPLLMVAVFGGMWWYHRRTLVPRQRELEGLLADYQARE